MEDGTEAEEERGKAGARSRFTDEKSGHDAGGTESMAGEAGEMAGQAGCPRRVVLV